MNRNLWQVYCYCLMKAAHEETKMAFNGSDITLTQGQFITGRESGARDCNMSASTFRNQLNKLEKLGLVDIHPDRFASIVTVLDTEIFRKSKTETGTAAGTTNGQVQETKTTGSSDGIKDGEYHVGNAESEGNDRKIPPLRTADRPNIVPVAGHKQQLNNNYLLAETILPSAETGELHTLIHTYERLLGSGKLEGVLRGLAKTGNFKHIRQLDKYLSKVTATSNSTVQQNDENRLFAPEDVVELVHHGLCTSEDFKIIERGEPVQYNGKVNIEKLRRWIQSRNS